MTAIELQTALFTNRSPRDRPAKVLIVGPNGDERACLDIASVASVVEWTETPQGRQLHHTLAIVCIAEA